MEGIALFKILVVVDDRELNRAVCSYLGQNGFEVMGCYGVNEAYDAMYHMMFDLIVSDIMMSEIDGLSLPGRSER